MKILLVMKRFSTNRDMIKENFGREIRLFSEINKLGHNVTILCADQINHERLTTKLNGMKVEIYPFRLSTFLKFTKIARAMANDCDAVVGSTHPVIGYVARLASAGKKKFVYDIRDNYETYNFSNMPLLKKGMIPKQFNNLLIKQCDLAVCVSETLRQKVARIRRNKPTIVVENGVSTKLFRPRSKLACRRKLELPPKANIIVYTGHISKDRGADKLIEAFKIVKEKIPDAMMLMSGQVDRSISLNQAGIIYKELPRRKEVALAISSADVAVVSQPENEISRYAFPYKIMEYLACGVPVVATAVGDVKGILKDHPEILCPPGNVEDMAEKIIAAITKKERPDYSSIVSKYSWERLARKLNTELVKLR